MNRRIQNYGQVELGRYIGKFWLRRWVIEALDLVESHEVECEASNNCQLSICPLLQQKLNYVTSHF